MKGLVDENGEIIETPDLKKLIIKLGGCKTSYTGAVNELKDLKSEIERLHALIERSKDRMQ